MSPLQPLWEIGVGTAMLLAVLIVHGAGMFTVQRLFNSLWPRFQLYRQILRDVFLGTLILGLLAIHYIEMLMWAGMLLGIDALPDLRTAFYFAGGAYTTYGAEGVYLPMQWRMLGFMIATSGLFTFGWTTGILVSLVTRFFQAAPKPQDSVTSVG